MSTVRPRGRRRRWMGAVVALTALLGAVPAAHGHGDVMRIGSTAAGGGQLRIEPGFDFDLDVVLPATAEAGGFTLHSSIFPSFTWVLEGADGLHPLSESVAVRLTLVAPISTAAVRLDGRLLDTANETATIGNFDPDPESHVHPEWQLVLPTGETGSFPIHFVLTTTAPGYTQSPVYSLTITNAVTAPPATPTATVEVLTATPTATAEASTATPSGVPTATATAGTTATAEAPATATTAVEPTATEPPPPTATATAAPPTATAPAACHGDCDGNGSVTIDDLIRAVGLAVGGGTSGCAAIDASQDGAITIDELVRAVRSALDGCAG